MHPDNVFMDFNDIVKDPFNRLMADANKAGKIPIGYTCSYVPEVLLSVDKFTPMRMRAPGITSTEMADTYLSLVLCTYTRSILEFAMNDQYDYIQGWVFASSCDHMCRLYDNINYLTKPSFSHIIDLPRIKTTEALKWYTEELQILVDKLSSNFGIDMGEKAISDAIGKYNDLIKLILSIGGSRKNEKPLVTGTEFHSMVTAYLVSPKDMIRESILAFHKKLKDRNGIGDYRARLMVVGGELDNPGFTEIIESMGGLVVADRYCTGSMPGFRPIETGNDPLASIASHTFNNNLCPRMMKQFENRLSYILKIVEEYNVDGVIVESIKFCDLWGIEATLLVSELRQAGVPVLRIDREYHHTAVGQLRTRVQAFLETMEK
jgi:benzoyl-CoA reductase/2-hydroxyglutaryl-CoA dehydratase subunit BcrC/BadD/HgdB